MPKRNVPEYIRKLAPYQPGKPIEELERELGIKKSIKLASNENPLGASPKAISAARRALGGIHVYPDGGCYKLKRALAKHYGLPPEMFIAGNGSNEIIELVIRTFARPGDEIVVSQYAFVIYQLGSLAEGITPVAVPARGYGHDLKAMSAAITPKTKVVFIANPNNPTGTHVTKNELADFAGSIRKDILIALDEAYCEYVTASDYPDSLQLMKSFPNIVALRTFSKIYGLAGLRVGYAIGQPELIELMNRIRQPFNVNSIAQAAAEAALADRKHVRESQTLVERGRKFLYRELDKLHLYFLPTQANCILIRVESGMDVYNGLLKRGVIVRPMDPYGLPEFVRVTIGTEKENKTFIKALGDVLGSLGIIVSPDARKS